MERGILAGLAAFRWAAWAWMAAVVVLTRDDLARPGLAAALVAAALVVTAGLTVALRVRPGALLAPPAIAIELVVAASLLAADGVAYAGPHSQSLGSAWPLAGVLAAGVALGSGWGLAAGVALGAARFAGVIGADEGEVVVLAATSTTVLYALAGGVAGFAAARLRAAEQEISAARAREEVARHLHDGVLQTLAVVQRRSTDTDLARLAREQERELRDFLFGSSPRASGSLGSELRRCAARFEDSFGGRARVVLAEDLPRLREATVATLTGAVGEALTNAGKHGDAAVVTIYVEPADGGVFCSVKDDGSGFDPGRVDEGVGLTRSIRGRVAEAGGRVDVTSRPGAGTEITLWLPA